MIKNENTLSKFLIFLAVIFGITFAYFYSVLDDIELQYILMSIFTLANLITLAFRTSNTYKKKNDIKNLIRREEQLLFCQSTSMSPASILLIDKIGEITVSNNYLSFIEVGNGQGYDFQVKGRAHDIMTHLYSILKPQEIKSIKLVKI